MSVKRSFDVYNASGQRFTISEVADVQSVATFVDRNATIEDGPTTLMTADGLLVCARGSGRYEVMETGEILTER